MDRDLVVLVSLAEREQCSSSFVDSYDKGGPLK